MATLANTSLLVQTEIKYNLKEQLSELLIHLSNGYAVLIPYDSDANHEPALKNGQRAHWAIILGFCIAINSNDFITEDYVCKIDQNNGQLIHLTSKQALPQSLLNTIDEKSFLDIYLYARQGKSKHLHLWNFDMLCKSNANLVENSEKHKNLGAILPSNGGIVEGLNNQSLFVKSNLK